jgi:thiamine-phosphate pyrophosphorylase
LSCPALAKLAGIYPLIDDDPRWGRDPRTLLEATLAGGATVLQLRLKHTPDREALTLCRWAAERAREAGALLIVNDRFELAELSGADGVHLGQDDLPPERIPLELRPRLLIGLSTHTLEQVRESRSRPVDYVAFGPVFGTRSKTSEYLARGADALAEAVRQAGRPVVAIGGIDEANLPLVRAAGARAAAVISAIVNAEDPCKATRRLREKFITPRER